MQRQIQFRWHGRLAHVFVLLGLIMAALLTGCNNSSSDSSKTADKTTPLSKVRPAPVNASTMMLKAGPPPITYIFSQGGRLRIHDATANKTLVNATVDPGTVIGIDAKSGVILGQQTAHPGPLSADHRYEIWWDAGR